MLPRKIKVCEVIHQVTNETLLHSICNSFLNNHHLYTSNAHSPTCAPNSLQISSLLFLLRLSVRCIRPCGSRHLGLPFISIRQQLLLVVQQLLPRLGGVLGVRRLDNGVDGARLLAEAAVDALRHVDVVAGRAAGTILTLLGFDGDGLGGADLEGFSQYSSYSYEGD